MRWFSQDDISYSKRKKAKYSGPFLKQKLLLDLIHENKADCSRTEFS